VSDAGPPGGEQSRRLELQQAERRGADQVRERLRRVVEEHRRVVRVGDLQVEVVEVAAIDEVLRD
jgi:hypothetical protein